MEHHPPVQHEVEHCYENAGKAGKDELTQIKY
jgi:hypothetical protein